MKCLFKELKIKKELKEFREFKKNYKFEMKEVVKKEDDSLYCDGICIREGKDGGALPKVLSNLFHYDFYFRGFNLTSVESVFQGFKFKDKKMQKLLFKYYGLDSNNIKAASDYNWKEEYVVFFQGKPMARDSKEYDDFIDEMYIALIQNPLYRNALKNVGSKYILHALGGATKEDTVFTRYEFERELNMLKDFVQSK